VAPNQPMARSFPVGSALLRGIGGFGGRHVPEGYAIAFELMRRVGPNDATGFIG
jgi:hypothetical protein